MPVEAGDMKRRQLDTPFVMIDVDKMKRNVAAMQTIANAAGVSLRPHAKTHKIPEIARLQLEAGAVGMTAAKLGEAEAMADGGVGDMLIAYPIVGSDKLRRLVRLASRVRIAVAVDSLEAALPMSAAASEAGVRIGVMVEVDCGFRRVGVKPGLPALELAQRIVKLPGLEFRGILTFGGQSYDAAGEERLLAVAREEGRAAVDTAVMLAAHGIPVASVSAGSTPSSKYVAKIPGITEIRPGTYVFGDLMQVAIGAHALEDCALSVKVAVVSRPSRGRAVVDAGTKILTSDGGDSPIGTGRGYVVGHPRIRVAWLTEEHGMLDIPEEDERLAVGDTLEIIPVHCCGVINMVDEVAAVSGEDVLAVWNVAGRGKSR